MSNEVMQYFKQFGDVEKVDMYTINGLHCGFMQFKSSDTAKLVLSQSKHCIENQIVKVTAADPWNQPDQILNLLNDDCLLAIFAYLSFIDLTIVSQVCVRFNQQAKESFKQQFKSLDLLNTTLFRDQIETLIQNFGQFICSLKVNMLKLDLEEDEFISLICKYCYPNLKELWLTSFDWNKVVTSQTLRSLEKLVLSENQFNRATKLTFAGSEIKELQIEGCSFKFGDWINQRFEKLKEAHFTFNSFFTSQMLNNFIILNPTLTKLIIANHIGLMSKASESVHCIGQHLHHLQELEFREYIQPPPRENIHDCVRNIQSLSQLQHLRILKFYFMFVPIAPLVESLATNQVPIEHLKLELGTIDSNVIKNITRMKQINVLNLRFISGLFRGFMLKLAKGLPQLQELHLEEVDGSSFIIDELIEMLPYANQLSILKLDPNYHIKPEKHMEIMGIVKKRPAKNKLLIEIWRNHSFEYNFPKSEILEVIYHKRRW